MGIFPLRLPRGAAAGAAASAAHWITMLDPKAVPKVFSAHQVKSLAGAFIVAPLFATHNIHYHYYYGYHYLYTSILPFLN